MRVVHCPAMHLRVYVCVFSRVSFAPPAPASAVHHKHRKCNTSLHVCARVCVWLSIHSIRQLLTDLLSPTPHVLCH